MNVLDWQRGKPEALVPKSAKVVDVDVTKCQSNSAAQLLEDLVYEERRPHYGLEKAHEVFA